MHYNYLEVYGLDDCFVYTTVEPTRAPCLVEGAVRFEVKLGDPIMLHSNRLGAHVKLIQEDWHDLYEIDDYLVEALRALSWFRKMKELIRAIGDGDESLKDFFNKHAELFERMKEKDPEVYHQLAVKVLFT